MIEKKETIRPYKGLKVPITVRVVGTFILKINNKYFTLYNNCKKYKQYMIKSKSI